MVRLFLAFVAVFAALPALALDKVTFATNWRAEAEHGGFYQAVVDGTYARYGLDVNILQGGPQVNTEILLATGRVDFAMGANTIQMLETVQQNVPIVTVASMFQIDPVIFMSHPGVGLDHFEDLPKATAFVAGVFRASVWQWLKKAHGFQDDKLRPYGFNSAPFIADKKSIQEGLLTSEPYAVEKQGGFKPNIFLLADYGYDSYSTTIQTRADTIDKKADLVQRFVDASIIGWYHYIYGDNAAANAAIKRDNPDITDGQIAFSLAKMKERGIVDSGDSLKHGIGAMTDARMKSFYDKMAASGLASADIDYKKGYTLRFINRKVGMELRPK
ncbi:ABC transporter substrate-binding protein [Methylocystis echinoides]|uniref:ABC transporter substrate-binding protein n=1 Tax=Methylocystis echinoides TaxID=29468 RepID=A0A9W6LR12_9HYPH|nr:ABC transporter substrate-binding protein [Methylocystis echinoides]GLI92135.1 ABC transporter substrate-binding protein [Methylocystis echinoides]